MAQAARLNRDTRGSKLELLLPALGIVGGFVALVWGADRFVEGAAATANNLGVSPLIIGLTIVGFGTSAPEMLVSAIAAASGAGGLSIGNAIGSNITNTALVLGVTALVTPLMVHSKVLRRELPLLLAIMLLSYGLMVFDGDLSRLDGGILLAGLAILVISMVAEGIKDAREGGEPLEEEFAEEIPTEMGLPVAITWTVVGLAVLLGSARLVVWGGTEVAAFFGVSDLVIGLTVVAIGTSLPEMAASVVSAMKGEHDIAIGNVVGSNMFNLLGVLALPGVIAPGEVDPGVLTRDYPAMFVLTVIFLIMARGLRVKSTVTRFQGGVLVVCFVAYIALLFVQTTKG